MSKVEDAQQRLVDAVKHLLVIDRLAGEILINISREIRPEGETLLDLEWQQNQLVLTGSAPQIMVTPMDELVNDCHHQALHILWKHPIRYADTTDSDLVIVACDVAVNQYLPEPPSGTMTLAKLMQILRQPLSAEQDSSYYLQKLRQMNVQQRQRFNQEVKKEQLTSPEKLHQGWFNSGNDLIRTGKLANVVRHSTEKLTEHQRGLLSQSVQASLGISQNNYELPFRKAFWKLIGPVSDGYQASRARFNRRQPQRLELPGKITRFVNQLYVFIDQSGSMSNKTVSQIISLINQLAHQAGVQMLVGDFDAQIQTPPQVVNPQHHLKMERHGGGGTSYQPIFDYLKGHNIVKSTPVMIITDGWGEEAIDPHGFYRILWLLTPDGKLSVKDNPGVTSRLKVQE